MQTLQKAAVRMRSNDQSFLWDDSAYSNNVLNGIAYNSNKGSFYLTGKNWPAVYEVKFTS